MAMHPFSRGIAGSLQRVSMLPGRYGLSPARMRARLSLMASTLNPWDVTPTIPVTAVTLEAYPEVVEDLDQVEVALHGYHHLGYSGRPRAAQASDLDSGLEALKRCELHVEGFRAPYLQADGVTFGLLRDRGILYDSSVPWLALPPDHPLRSDLAELAARRYGFVADRPSDFAEPVIELPVCMPDDEMLVDGLRIRNPAILRRIFESMLDVVARDGSLLLLQIHPERFHVCASAIESVLARATQLGAWKAPLRDIARWVQRRGGVRTSWPRGSPFAVAVTGDLDAVTLWDFARRVYGG